MSRASGVFAFSDFTACNAVVGVEGDWRKLVYRQTPLTANENLEKIEITKRVFTVFSQYPLRSLGAQGVNSPHPPILRRP